MCVQPLAIPEAWRGYPLTPSRPGMAEAGLRGWLLWALLLRLVSPRAWLHLPYSLQLGALGPAVYQASVTG